MILEKHQYRRFIRLYETLINYCAVEAGTQESLEASILNEDVKAFLEAERMIWAPDGDRGIIDRYVEKNPFNFSMDDLAEVQSWSRAINDTFTVCQRGLETLFICGWRAFSVRGLDREIGEALSHMPATVRATLLPFDDTIIFAITMSEIAYETDRDKIERIEREVTDYLKLDKVHRTAHEFIMLSHIAYEEQLSRKAQSLIEDTEAAMGRKLIGMHEGPLAHMGFDEREQAVADNRLTTGPQVEHTDVLSALSIPGEPTDDLAEILRRCSQTDLAQLATYMQITQNAHYLPHADLVRQVLDYNLFAPDNISWLMNLAIMTGSDATDRLGELYHHNGPLEYAYAEISGDNWPLPILPLSVLFEVGGEGPGHFLLQAPREAREALRDYDWDLASDKARAQEALISTLNLACEMYGIVFFDEFTEQLGFQEFADTYGTKFANTLLTRIVTLSMNDIVTFGVFHQSDGSVFFAHNCMRPYLSYTDSDNAVADLADNPVVTGMLKSREAYPARPLGDWGEASDLYEFMHCQEPTRRLVQFLDAHVPDSQDDYEFADTVMQDEIDVNRLVRIDTDNALEDLQETYDFNADEATLEELAEILDAFTAIIPSWYYYGWSQKDVSDGAFHSE